jgi:hypothetical protein
VKGDFGCLPQALDDRIESGRTSLAWCLQASRAGADHQVQLGSRGDAAHEPVGAAAIRALVTEWMNSSRNDEPEIVACLPF